MYFRERERERERERKFCVARVKTKAGILSEYREGGGG